MIDLRNKGSNTLILDGNLAKEELYKKEQAEKTRIRRKSGNRQVQKYGVVYKADAKLRIATRDEREDQEELRISQAQEVCKARAVEKQLQKAALNTKRVVIQQNHAVEKAREREGIESRKVERKERGRKNRERKEARAQELASLIM